MIQTLHGPVDEERLLRKLSLVADLIEAGRFCPDHVEIAAVVDTLTQMRELRLARRFELIARRLMPQFQKDLT